MRDSGDSSGQKFEVASHFRGFAKGIPLAVANCYVWVNGLCCRELVLAGLPLVLIL